MPSVIRQAELALLNAPFETDGWTRAIDHVARAAHAATANLVGLGGPALMPLNLFTGRDDADCARAFGNPLLWGDCNWRVRADAGVMTVRHDAHYRLARAHGGTEAYDDVCADLDIMHGCQASLINGHGNFLGLALLRGRRAGPADGRMLDVFTYLLRPLQRAIRVQLAMDGEAADLMLDGTQGLSGRVVLIDRHGCLAAMSPSAEPLFEDGGPLHLAGLCPAFRDRIEQRLFHKALGRMMEGEPEHAPVHVMRAGRCVERPSGRWRVTIMRLPVAARRLGFEPHVAVNFSDAHG